MTYAFTAGGKKPYIAKNESLDLIKAAIGHSYSCKNESISLGNEIYLEVTQDRVQAFNFTVTNQFGLPDLCKADQPHYAVAIAVGIVLLILIVIVILAYICRRRSDGYESL
ncbi:lysosome-associated membrane glycoprotein 1-like isoform X2 [Alosa sapidissima]|uniref:lysosome-associated membrane glycoprotein 1-like isoform X2 n=1 Tax=Alosa sapidissima TaxID=34773 RepID=UPI001C08698D|nr:lysosome-associated membrane glycoprotein 1-like isoform X2 [Alosa sapidissima]